MRDPATYSPPIYDPSVDLDLSRNEGRTRAAELIAAVADPDRAVSRYPDTSGVRARLAAIHGLDPSRILVTAGGDDALSRCFPALLGEGGRAVTTYPTFEMISRYAEQSRVDLVEVPWWTGSFPVGEIIAAADRADIAFIVSPNNPTGAALTGTDLKRVAAEFRYVVLDAAYVEFADEDLTPTALGMDNVVVIRTLSKAYGLAGLRVGYLLGPPELVIRIAAYGSPYPVAALSAAVAESRLSWPTSETERFVETIRSERSRLADTLTRLETRPVSSQANFVLTECDDADWVMTAARSLGVAFRRFADRPGMEQMVRVTVPGDAADFDRLVSTLESALAPQALVFDLDGVLADVSRSQTVAIIETAKSFGVGITPADVELGKAGGNANDDWALTQDLCATRGVEIPLDVLTERYESLYQGRGATPGLKELERPLVDVDTWRRWGRDRPLAVVTGRPRPDAEEFLERFDLMSGTAALITRDEAPLKPDPTPVRLALETLGVTAAWMLGDTPDDVVAARGAGVVPIGVIAPGDDPIQARHRLRLAARVLDQITDLEEMMP
jgi:histidinol-phosphate aminotransferase